MRTSALLIVAALVCAGCATQPGGSTSSASPGDTTTGLSPPPPLKKAVATIFTPSGKLTFPVEVAEDEAERAYGLMGRTTLRKRHGMVFSYHEPTQESYWMKNTQIPLSIAFWDEAHRIVAILDMDPCDADPCPLYNPGVSYVGALEVNQGELVDVRVGDRITVFDVTLEEAA